MTNVWHECLRYAIYYAPRGRRRLVLLGESIAQRYLAPGDRLVGIMGERGTGKSSIVSGMFPGLELTNDDEGVNVRPCPLLRMHREGRFGAHTFHVDARFEAGFEQPHAIAEAVRAAVGAGRRVVVEHFDFLYPLVGINAELLVGVGEEIVVARPDAFGPWPEDVARAIEGTGVYRRMAHSAEDLTAMVLARELGLSPADDHSDVPRGFVIELQDVDGEPEVDLEVLERRVRDIIATDLEVAPLEDAIRVGEWVLPCTGPRIHVARTSEIRNFRLARELARFRPCQSDTNVGPKFGSL